MFKQYPNIGHENTLWVCSFPETGSKDSGVGWLMVNIQKQWKFLSVPQWKNLVIVVVQCRKRPYRGAGDIHQWACFPQGLLDWIPCEECKYDILQKMIQFGGLIKSPCILLSIYMNEFMGKQALRRSIFPAWECLCWWGHREWTKQSKDTEWPILLKLLAL